MNPRFRIRLVAFVVAIAVQMGLMGWAGHTSLKRIKLLQTQLASIESTSFQIADHFQKTILQLNNDLLLYQIRREPELWEAFQDTSRSLDAWIDTQLPEPSRTAAGTNILSRLNDAYDDYLRVARALGDDVRRGGPDTAALARFAALEQESRRLVTLSYDLAKAHRESFNDLLRASNRALVHLHRLAWAEFVVLLVFGAGLSAVVYRDLIAPLRTRLVESHAVIERQEKLASLGLLAAGVAHEIRNPLTAIKARLFTLQKHLPGDSPLTPHAEVIGGEIDRLERIVREFLQFARPPDPELSTVPADQPLRAVQTLLAPQLEKQRIRLVLDATVTDPVRVDPQQIQQVLINLVQNAADSIGEDGGITLRTRLEARPGAAGGRRAVALEVADNGRGMLPEVEKRLFDPFFTTKEGGTGLGLCIAARIVEKHGGVLRYQTQPNRGTTFGVVLPLA
jgi:signal transduction histidine kinase